MKFCDSCDRLLDKHVKDGVLKFHCPNCGEIFDSNPDDTLMKVYEPVKKDIIPRKLIKNAVHSPTISRTYEHCDKCKKTVIASYIRFGVDYRRTHICNVCEHVWSK